MSGGGYIYVIEFSNGTVKVGRSAEVTERIKVHDATARSFGLSIISKWTSPLHRDWKDNEEKLKALAEELGGVPNNGEYFAGLSFGLIAAAAAGLPFEPPGLEAERAPQRKPDWLAASVASGVVRCAAGDWTPDEMVASLSDDIIRRDPGLTRLLVERHVRRNLSAGLRKLAPEAFASAPAASERGPEPPEPSPSPPAGAPRLPSSGPAVIQVDLARAA